MKFTTYILSAISALAAMTLSASAEAPASYALCAACHQATGLGLPGAFPPLAGSEWVNGNPENLIRIQLRGLTGPITVKGATYGVTPMPPNAAASDDEIAEVLTYIRSSWGNTGTPVTADMVKALRSEVGKPMLTVADLKDPNAKPAATGPKKLDLKSGEFTKTKEVGSSDSYVHYVYGFILLCAIPTGLALVGRKK